MIGNQDLPSNTTQTVQNNIVTTEPTKNQFSKSSGYRMSKIYIFKLFLTLILLAFLFVLAFLISLSATNREKAKENANVVPNAQIELPQNISSPTPSPIAEDPEVVGWVEYKNSKWDYSFSFPQEELTHCEAGEETDVVGLWQLPFSCPEAHDVLYKIGVSGYQKSENIESRSPESSEEISIGDYKAVKKKYVYKEEDGPLFAIGESTEIIFSNDKESIVFHLLSKDEKDLATLDKVVSSFRFTP